MNNIISLLKHNFPYPWKTVVFKKDGIGYLAIWRMKHGKVSDFELLIESQDNSNTYLETTIEIKKASSNFITDIIKELADIAKAKIFNR